MSLNDLEGKRKKYRNRIFLSIIIFAIIVYCITSLATVYDDFIIFLFFSIIIGVTISIFLTSGPRKKYSKAYKEYFVLKGLKKIFTDLNYEPESGIPRSTIADTHMMCTGDIYKSNDFISGKYKDVAFSQADVDIQEEQQTTDSNGNTTTYYVTIFRGRWMIFDFNKEFKANVQVAQKGFGNNIVKQRGLFSKKDDNSYYQNVKMESESFNKRFNVYAQSEHEAFYILTPSLMEKIERLDDNNKGKLLLCFINNRLHIGLYDKKDSFEAPNCLFKINEEKELNRTNGDIKVITQFIDELNLDNTLFKKLSINNEQINQEVQQNSIMNQNSINNQQQVSNEQTSGNQINMNNQNNI